MGTTWMRDFKMDVTRLQLTAIFFGSVKFSLNVPSQAATMIPRPIDLKNMAFSRQNLDQPLGKRVNGIASHSSDLKPL